MSNIAQVCEFWAGKIPVKIINFHSLTPDAQAYNQLRRTQRKPFQLTWIYIYGYHIAMYCHMLPMHHSTTSKAPWYPSRPPWRVVPPRLQDQQNFPRPFRSDHLDIAKKWETWKKGDGNLERVSFLYFFVTFFAHVFSTAPVPADLILSRSTRELYKRLF